jgi:energy-converting hydrogenase Eha subunit C
VGDAARFPPLQRVLALSLLWRQVVLSVAIKSLDGVVSGAVVREPTSSMICCLAPAYQVLSTCSYVDYLKCIVSYVHPAIVRNSDTILCSGGTLQSIMQVTEVEYGLPKVTLNTCFSICFKFMSFFFFF